MNLKELSSDQSYFQIVAAVKAKQEETPIPEADLVQCLWHGLMSSVDWSARADQIESLALREVAVNTRSSAFVVKY